MRRQELADAAEEYVHDCLDAAGAPDLGSAALDAIVEMAKGRFLGVGAAQYQISETEQSFERSTIGTMLVGLTEELVDQVNYCCMIDILIGRRLDANASDDPTRRQIDTANTLLELQADLGAMAYAAVYVAATLRRHLDNLIEIGEYTPRAESDYVAQLAAECDEAGAPMAGAVSGRSSREIEESYDQRMTPDTPAGLDAIEAAHELARMDDDGAGVVEDYSSYSDVCPVCGEFGGCRHRGVSD